MSDTEDVQKIATRIMRANAKRVFTTQCTACGKSRTQSLRWLQTKRFVCPSCGGRLDDSPLHQLTLSVLRELRSGAGTPKKRATGQVKPATAKQFTAVKGYQLVLQFRGDSLGEFDAMVALEDELIEHLGDSADVDGHDVGSGECNIFIFTSDPVATFDRAKAVLERRQQLRTVTAAYREVEGENYTLIWPEDSRAEFRLL
jgi:hypothetical protein